MHTAYQPVAKVLCETLALMTRREREVWSLHDTNTGILAIAKGRFKSPPHINHSLSQVGPYVPSLVVILAPGWFDDTSHGGETLMRATCRSQEGSCASVRHTGRCDRRARLKPVYAAIASLNRSLTARPVRNLRDGRPGHRYSGNESPNIGRPLLDCS
jgi:hypothetical protein